MRKTLFLLMVLLMPCIANAYNYWSITASTSPTLPGAITPPSGPDYSTTGSTTNVVTSTVTTADFTVNPAPTGYVLSYVTIDGVRTSPISGNTYRVSKGSSINHTISAYYAVKKYTITTSKVGNGIIDPTVSVSSGGSQTINMAAGSGYRIASVSSSGAVQTGGDGITSAAYTFSNVQADQSISVTFEVIPVVTAKIGTSPQTIVTGTLLTIDGSASSYTVPATFTWTVTPAGATLAPAPDGKTAVFSSPVSGTYTIKLALSAAGATSSEATVDIGTITQAAYDSSVCASCHNDYSPSIMAAYNASTHATTASVSCQACHNPTGTLPHYYNLLHETVSPTTFLFTDPSAGPVGTNFCANCHSSAQLAQSDAHAAVSCGTCHNNDVHKPDIANGGVNATFCATCHGPSAAALPPLSAGHGTQCSGCHGANAHTPHATDGIAATPCFACHNKANQAHYFEIATAQLDGLCGTCHAGTNHDPQVKTGVAAAHFNGYTSTANPGFAAAYLTPATRCAGCHLTAGATVDGQSDPALFNQRTDWAASGHGDTKGGGWLAGDFKTLAGCVRCHTAGGFVAYSSGKMTGAQTATDDRSRAVLSCDSCHTDLKTGAVRSVPAVQPYAGDSYVHPDLGTSSLCVSCHSGTQSGRTIKARAAASGDFSNMAFIDSHRSAAAGILLKSIGYQYAFKSYSNTWHFKHDRIGKNRFKAYGYDTGNSGACVGCHMTSPNKHTFLPVAKDGTGAITGITSASCGGCHTGPAFLDVNRMNARKAKFAAGLLALRKVLETRGIYYAEVAPYFFKSTGNTTAGNAYTNWGNPDTMGAAFNFNLLQHEPGAYAHNMIYAKRLIYDSIDYLDNGALDGSVTATINALPTLDATQKAAATGYITAAGARP